jgi:hypothetical protein
MKNTIRIVAIIGAIVLVAALGVSAPGRERRRLTDTGGELVPERRSQHVSVSVARRR